MFVNFYFVIQSNKTSAVRWKQGHAPLRTSFALTNFPQKSKGFQFTAAF